ncbi:hypothetical protein [Vibrio agarivorans]|uniref:hypothetical protein n=1 Tax=Vibrio agarivorans TaxID=153622 RepID=UPI0025B3AEC5|nr:hypothetical protein [Vibrio agarivorans]MDN3660406.1 hypothetical protein [Vibrio agarivorans]
MKYILLVMLVSISGITTASEQRIPAYKAPFHVGETVMACGEVAQVSKGRKATYLNMDNRYPNQTLGILIWDNYLPDFERRFGDLREMENERVCARGKITEYKGTLQIQVANPQFLRLMM